MNLAFTIAAVIVGLIALGWAIWLVVRGPRLLAIPLGYLGVVAFAWVTMAARTEGYRPKTPPDEYAATRPTQEPMDDYVTSDTCRSCHPGEHHSWHNSYHRTMTQLATPESVKGDFKSGFVAEFPGMNVRFSEDNGEFWATYAFPNASGTGYQKIGKRRIVMTTGSHHYQVYWTDRPWVSEKAPGDRTVWLVPYVYLFDEQQWIPRQASFLMPPTDSPESSEWNKSCIRCHTTRGIERHDPENLTHDSRTVEFGISCEACHGPGKEHIEANRDPLRRYALHQKGEGDPTIVNPARLDHERSAEVCGQCHSINVPLSIEGVKRFDLEGRDFRPGDDLDDSALVLHPGRGGAKVHEELFPEFFADRFWSDGMVRVAGREYQGLLGAPCFQRGDMSCLSCHTMHPGSDDPRNAADWANDQLKLGMRGNAACTQCHEDFAETATLTDHTHHGAGSSGSNCYNCHMPHTTYGLLKGIRSHQIDSPSVKITLETGRPNACNLCHLDQTLAWTSDKLDEWHSQRKPKLSPDESSIAASLLWLLTGDAGQRALIASAMGNSTAQEVSGTDWMAPFLGQLHFDPYPAVQIIANKSLRTIEGFSGLPRFPETETAARETFFIWKENQSQRRGDTALLIDAEGKTVESEVLRLLQQRDDSPVNLAE